MLSQTVQVNRAFLFFRKYAFENKKAYLFLYLAIAAFLVLWLGVQLGFTNANLFNERGQVAYYFVTLFLSGCLSAGVLFSELGVKPKAISYLLTPASTTEKFVCNLFFGVLVFFAVYSALFTVVDFVAVTLANRKFGTHWEVINVFQLNKYQNPFLDGPVTDTFYLYFPAQALFILASIYFNKHGLFKAIVGMGLLWVCCIVLFLLVRQMLPPGGFNKGFSTFEVMDASGDNKVITISSGLMGVVAVFFKFGITPLLWMASYFRLREKEL